MANVSAVYQQKMFLLCWHVSAVLANLDRKCLLMSSFYWKLLQQKSVYFLLLSFHWLLYLQLNFNCNIFCLQVLINNLLFCQVFGWQLWFANFIFCYMLILAQLLAGYQFPIGFVLSGFDYEMFCLTAKHFPYFWQLQTLNLRGMSRQI